MALAQVVPLRGGAGRQAVALKFVKSPGFAFPRPEDGVKYRLLMARSGRGSVNVIY